MKVLKLLSVCTLVLVGIVSANWVGEESLRGQELRSFIDGIISALFKAVIKKIPDPLLIPYFNTTFDNQTLLSGYLRLSNLKLAGIHKFVASKIVSDIGKGTANITIEASDVHLDFDYDADITLLDLLPLYGAGTNSILLQNLNLELFTSLQILKGLKFKVKELNATMTLEALLFDLHGLIHNEDFSKLISTMLNDNVGLFLNQYAELVSAYISPVLKEILNAILSKKNTAALGGLEEYHVPEYDLEWI